MMQGRHMYSLTYASSAIRPYSIEELRSLLQISRTNNGRAGITGMLLYKGGNFMQVLEGEREAVLATMARITADPDHRGVLVLLSSACAQRTFGTWSMGFRDLDGTGTRTLPGYDEFLNTPLTDERFVRDPVACQKLLRIFKRDM
jgi:hypothetical protein